MRRILAGAAILAASAVLLASANGPQADTGDRAAIILDNPHVRVFRTTGSALAGVEHKPGVVVPIDKPEMTRWTSDAAVPPSPLELDRWQIAPGGAPVGPLVIVEPRPATTKAPPLKQAAKPGDAPATGMSFKTMFENATVAVLRARMDVGAKEGFHTHASDTIVVYLTDGEIENTVEGTTRTDRWKKGDAEFEARGSSHSARNAGQAIDVVLVTLKP